MQSRMASILSTGMRSIPALAFLEVMRSKSRSFCIKSHGTTGVRGKAYATVDGRIDDLCGAAAAYCKRHARDEIGARLSNRVENPSPNAEEFMVDPAERPLKRQEAATMNLWEYANADQLTQSPPCGKWTLDGGLPSSQHLFREIARKAFGRLHNPSSIESWRLWLDLLRTEGYTRKIVPKIVPWRQFKATAKSSENLPLPQRFENEQIEGLFKSSADFCLVRSVSGSAAVEFPEVQNPPSSAQSAEDGLGPNPRVATDATAPTGEQLSAQENFLGFASETERNAAIASYTMRWNCSEASLARTAKVGPWRSEQVEKGLVASHIRETNKDRERTQVERQANSRPEAPRSIVGASHLRRRRSERIFANAPTLSANVSEWQNRINDG
jgi:hypothetical protein